jgi:hypothetical protein
MIRSFIPPARWRRMVRRTVSLPESVDELIRSAAREGESYSAAVARLVREGARAASGPRPRYVASGEGPEDLSERTREYLLQLLDER